VFLGHFGQKVVKKSVLKKIKRGEKDVKKRVGKGRKVNGHFGGTFTLHSDLKVF
jgi:hypothetical protein